MLNVAPQKERIPDHLRAMAEQDDKSAASGKTGGQSSIGVGCAPGEERDSAITFFSEFCKFRPAPRDFAVGLQTFEVSPKCV